WKHGRAREARPTRQSRVHYGSAVAWETARSTTVSGKTQPCHTIYKTGKKAEHGHVHQEEGHVEPWPRLLKEKRDRKMHDSVTILPR
ncbi:hypothetical protein Dimus_032084, partial [Dionaea muscipula]